MKERSIWENITKLISNVTDTLIEVSNATSSIAKTSYNLSSTAEVMSENNKDLVVLESNAKKKIKKKELEEKYKEYLESVK